MSIPNKKKVSKRGVNVGRKYTAGIGYLIVPEGIDRDKYIINCFRNGTISFITENAERFDNVKVTKGILNDLEFPKSKNKPGSQILFNFIPIYNIPVVIGLFTKSGEVNLMSENSFDLTKRTESSIVSVVGNAKDGTLNINVDSFQDDKGGEFFVNVSNKSKKAKLKVAVNGNIELESTDETLLTSAKKIRFYVINPKDKTKSTEIIYEKEKGLTYKDEFENKITIDGTNIRLEPKKGNKFNIGDGKEPLILGTTFVNMLNEILTQIQAITVPTPVGPSGIPNNASVFAKIQTQLETLKSKISFTD